MTDIRGPADGPVEPEEVEGELVDDVPAQHPTQPTLFAEYSGPLPPAQEFNAYSGVVPDGSERVLRMAEQAQAAMIDQRSRQLGIDEKMADEGAKALRRVDWFALIAILAGLAAAVVVALSGRELAAAGIALSGAGAGTVIKVFLGRGSGEDK